jgi:glycosyltransferase involved in cell wall biosynthesis
MKIAIDTLFEHATEPSSAVDYLVNLASYLPLLGPEHEYYLLVSGRSAFRYEPLRRTNVHLVDCFASNDRRALRILSVQTIVPWRMRQLGIDILFSAGNVCPWWGSFCRVLKINTLHHCRTPEALGRMRSLYRRYAFGASAKKTDTIMANSISTRDDICHFLGVPERKVKVVWEAADESFVRADVETQNNTRRRVGLEKPYLLFASTLWPYKNAHTLIRAYSLLCKRPGIDADLVFAGRIDDPAYRRELEALVEEEKLGTRVRFLGFVPNREMPSLYSAAEVFVYPSLSETFGKPLVEAMRCEVPVIASNTSCIPEIAGNGALLVDPNNVEELAAAIYRVLTEPGLRSELVELGRKRSEVFSWRTSARQTLDLFEETYAGWGNGTRAGI